MLPTGRPLLDAKKEYVECPLRRDSSTQSSGSGAQDDTEDVDAMRPRLVFPDHSARGCLYGSSHAEE
jgi:hypothetical protein